MDGVWVVSGVTGEEIRFASLDAASSSIARTLDHYAENPDEVEAYYQRTGFRLLKPTLVGWRAEGEHTPRPPIGLPIRGA